MRFNKQWIAIILAIVLMLTNKPTPSALRGAVSWLISPLYHLLDWPYQFVNWVSEQGRSRESLISKINQLTHENIALKAQLQTYSNTQIELENLRKILETSYQLQSKNTKLAAINHINQSRFKKQIILNQGSNDGIKIGQIVIGEKGVIGQIIQTMPYYSTVLTIADPTHYIAVKSLRNNIRAVAQGLPNYRYRLRLNFVPKDADIKLGDIFVSSELLDYYFPKNHPVAQVVYLDNKNPTFMTVELQPIEKIDQLEFVLITTNE